MELAPKGSVETELAPKGSGEPLFKCGSVALHKTARVIVKYKLSWL